MGKEVKSREKVAYACSMDVVCSTCYRNRDSFTSEIAGLGKERLEYFAEMFVYLDGRIYRSMGTLPDRRYAYNGKAVDFVCTAVVSSGRRLAGSEIFLGNGRLCSRTYIFDRLDFVQKQILSGGNYSLADTYGDLPVSFPGRSKRCEGKSKTVCHVVVSCCFDGNDSAGSFSAFPFGKGVRVDSFGGRLVCSFRYDGGKKFFPRADKRDSLSGAWAVL